jgi:sterol desaturase/sphingolipid hydroxylase (fatty acid hydroxylase superfamily)
MGIMSVFMTLERLFPRKKLPEKDGWFLRALMFNFFQLGIVVVGSLTWEHYIFTKYDHCTEDQYCRRSYFQMTEKGFNPVLGGFIAYVVNSWVFYWWHLIRHENYTMWLTFHQAHHAPVRIETITSFVKHPMEIFANSIIMTTLVYPILGLDIQANIWLSIFSALGEYFYHMNIRTPHWIGYFIQRPESHDFHHQLDGRFVSNYSDFPIWDIANKTFFNPTDEEVCETGFSNDKENRVGDLLTFEDIRGPKKTEKRLKKFTNIKYMQFYRSKTLFYFLLCLGCMSTFGYMLSFSNIRSIGFMTVASPLPLVFSVHNGIETFSTSYNITVQFYDNTTEKINLDNSLYDKLKGPYNRKNMYGIVLSHGPFFLEPNLIKMRDDILQNAVCHNGIIATELGMTKVIDNVDIQVRSKTVGNEDKQWNLQVKC